MIEIVALFFLCKRNGILAMQKGLNPTSWKWFTVLGWLVAEIFGVILGMTLFGFDQKNLFGLSSLGLVSAFGGYLIVKSILEKKPDVFDEDNTRTSIDELRPPPKSLDN